MGQEVREFLSKTIFGRQRQAKVIQCGRRVKIASLWAVLSIRIHFILGPWKLFDSRLMFTWTFLLELYTPEGLHLLENFLLPFLVLPRPTKGKKRRKATTTTRRIEALFLSFFTIKLFPGTAWIEKKRHKKKEKKTTFLLILILFKLPSTAVAAQRCPFTVARLSHNNPFKCCLPIFLRTKYEISSEKNEQEFCTNFIIPFKKNKTYSSFFFCLIRANDIQRLVSSYPLQISKVKSFFHPKKKKGKASSRTSVNLPKHRLIHGFKKTFFKQRKPTSLPTHPHFQTRLRV